MECGNTQNKKNDIFVMYQNNKNSFSVLQIEIHTFFYKMFKNCIDNCLKSLYIIKNVYDNTKFKDTKEHIF